MRQLHAVLSRSLAGTGDGFVAARRHKKVTAKQPINLRRYEGQSVRILTSFTTVASKPGATCEPGFTDSEAEEEADAVRDDPALDDIPHRSVEGTKVEATCLAVEQMEPSVPYPDTAVDRRHRKIFAGQAGYGRPVAFEHVVLTWTDSDNPFYFLRLDTKTLKIKYTQEGGLPLGYLVHKNLLTRLLTEAHDAGPRGEETLLELRERILPWIITILRSPLSDELKFWFLRNIETCGQDPQPPPISSTNSLVISYSLACCCPSGTMAAAFLKRALAESLLCKSEGFASFCVAFGTLLCS